MRTLEPPDARDVEDHEAALLDDRLHEDLTGNAWEWVAEWFSATFHASGPSTDPPGADSGSVRVVRRGSWRSVAAALRVANPLEVYQAHRPPRTHRPPRS